MYSEQLGEDFISFLGDNPLQNSFDLKLKADFVTPEKTIEIKGTNRAKSLSFRGFL